MIEVKLNFQKVGKVSGDDIEMMCEILNKTADFVERLDEVIDYTDLPCGDSVEFRDTLNIWAWSDSSQEDGIPDVVMVTDHRVNRHFTLEDRPDPEDLDIWPWNQCGLQQQTNLAR